MNSRLFTSKQSARIIALHSKGKSQREIAETIGRSRSGVWGVLSRAKLLKAKPKTKAKQVKPRSKSETRRHAVQKGKKR